MSTKLFNSPPENFKGFTGDSTDDKKKRAENTKATKEERSFKQLMRNEINKMKKYTNVWEAFNARNVEETAQARRDLRFTNNNRGGAPKISTFGMCLSGAFSKGAMEILTTLRKKSFRVHPLLTTLPVPSAICLHATSVL